MLAFQLARLIDRDDIRVFEAACVFCFSMEPAYFLLAGQLSGQNHLDGHNSLRVELARFENHTHGTPSDLAQQFIIAEPFMNRLSVQGVKHDDEVWQGDSVDVFVSTGSAPQPFYHYIVNPNNVQWDARGNDAAAFNGQWQSAVKKTPGAWEVELALPWSQMGMSEPPAGTTRRVNLGRVRRAGVAREFSSWSPVVKGFVEPEHFGYWKFQ